MASLIEQKIIPNCSSFFVKEVATETLSTTTSIATPANLFCSFKEIPNLSNVFFISGSKSSRLSNTGFCFGAE